MSPSSVSTTESSSFSRYSAASSAMSSGIGPGSPSLPPSGLVYAHMCSTSTIPVRSCSDPIGMCTATQCGESWELSWSSVRKKSARSRSSMLTNTTRARPIVLGEPPGSRGADLDAHHRGHRHEGALDDTRGRAQLALEARVARHVDQVQLPVLPGRVRERHRDRELPRVLVLVRVGHRRPGLDRPEPVHRAGLEEQRFHERRLSRPAVADDGDVADLRGLGHGLALLLGTGFEGEA